MRNELVYLVNIETVIGSLMQSLELLSQRILYIQVAMAMEIIAITTLVIATDGSR